jgi:3-hydroxyisobutyrate dehydrogenase-like beta-hydroxyacid dehydrogenase
MVTNLAQKGNLDKPVLIYNRSPQRAVDLAAQIGGGKTEVVTSPVEAARRADVIFTMLSNDAAVEENYTLLLDGLQGDSSLADKLFVECSTISPETTERVAARVTATGAAYLASPVFGAPASADAGTLIFVPAGPAAVVDRLRPLADGVMGRPGGIIAMADRPYGASLTLKLIGNTFVVNMVTQIAEGMTLAEKSGVGVEPLQKVLDLLFGGVYSAYGARMTSGTYWKMEEPLFSADNAIKDMTHAQSVAAKAGVELRNVANAKSYMEDVKEHVGGAKGDIAGIYGAVRMRSGLKYENDA